MNTCKDKFVLKKWVGSNFGEIEKNKRNWHQIVTLKIELTKNELDGRFWY